jgi:enoyl-CoA hydratase
MTRQFSAVESPGAVEAPLVRLERDGPIARLTVDREQQMNALNREVLTQLDHHLGTVAADESVRVVLVTGAGKAFVAGADIAEMQSMTAVEAQSFSELGHTVFRKIERMAQPVIAMVNGYALGGGMELAMACDLRIISENAHFGQPEVHLGITPGFGGSQRLPRIVGQGRALEWLLTGAMMGAQEALRIGLANKVVEAGALEDAALELADQLLSQGPGAIATVKRAVYEGADVDLDKALAIEATLFGACFSGPEQKEGMAAFLAHHAPSFGYERVTHEI